MPSKNYARNILEQIDIHLCKLEHKVERLKRLKGGYYPTYDENNLPNDLINGQGFLTGQGHFCVYLNGVIHCMPAVTTGIIMQYYPNLDYDGGVIGILSTDGTLNNVWQYVNEDPTSDWSELDPYNGEWVLDRTYMTIYSYESRSSGDDWTTLENWWLMSADGSTRIKVTQGLTDETRTGGLGGVSFWGWKEAFAFKYISSTNRLWLLRQLYSVAKEYIFANGTIAYGTAHPEYGPLILEGYPESLWGTETDSPDDSVQIVGPDDLPDTSRWGSFYPSISHDGSKIGFILADEYPTSSWTLHAFDVATTGTPGGGTFTITVGNFPDPDLSTGQTTAPIPWNATAEDVFNAVVALSNIDGPDDRGVGYPGYAASASSGYLWEGNIAIAVLPHYRYMTTDWSDLEWITSVPARVEVMSQQISQTDEVWICDRDGSNLTHIPLNSLRLGKLYPHPTENYFGALDTIDGASIYGDYRSRWVHIDANTYEVTEILNSDVLGGSDAALGITKFSPDGTKLYYILEDIVSDPPTFVQIWVCDVDGTNRQLVYSQPSASYDNTDFSFLYVSTNQIAWSFNNEYLFCVDGRDDATGWLAEVATGNMTKIYTLVGEETLWYPRDFDI